MTKEGFREYFSAALSAASFDESGEWLVVLLENADEWKPLARNLKNDPLRLNYLFCITCIDWKTHLSMVYHFSSTEHRQTVVIKVRLNRDEPEIETVCDTWKTAEFHEREVHEMFGVRFLRHPDLRKLILPDDFEGFPLRKDFEDEVNMVRL